ncbi:MAG: UvrD-helicase domain-containing protein [Bacteroidales bacterium]|nr:UvrD-helicase domain-containing protein [Bacteroidales bacterium]
MAKNFLEELNEAQRQAVLHTEGPSMVIAGAGSGKTRVLTYRVANLLQQGVDPFNILALTFTNKAAREMKERIMKLVGSADARNVWMGTFHSIFARVLRIDGHLLGYPSNYTIYDTDDSKSLIRTIVKEHNLDPKVYQPGWLLGRISAAKSNLLSAADYNQNPELIESDTRSGKPLTGRLFSVYSGRCKKAFAMDFDDLLFNMNLLLRDFPEILLKYQSKFRYVLVDEYQDTNYAQYMIVKKLAARHENICVVGDDAQSIYSFRGANIQNILNFKKDYPDLKIFKLEQNYRSTKNIVEAANSVIQYNKDQIFKKIWTQNDEGSLIKLLRAKSDMEEGNLVASSIFETKMSNQLPNSEFAILYRTNAQSRSIEEALRKLNIPYRIYGGLSFYKRKEIKDLLAYFRLVVNPSDEEALKRIINYPGRGIGDTTIDRLVVAAEGLGKSVWELIESIDQYELKINQGIKNRIGEFVMMIKRFMVQQKKRNAYELAKDIARASGILKDLEEDKTPEGISRVENIEELLNGIKEFSESEDENILEEDNSLRTLDMYLQDISLLTDADQDDKDDNNKVSLMTIHSAKGLEFPYVYIVGLEENLFPSIQSISSRADLEEERRLFYVAITRAEKAATISYAETRYRWGNLTISEPSRFIEEIDTAFIEFPRKVVNHPSDHNKFRYDAEVPFTKKPSTINPDKLRKIGDSRVPSGKEEHFESSDSGDIQTGMKVMHQRFGNGKVLSVEGNGPNRKATVFFPEVGQKHLILKFARLKIVD